MKLDQIRAAISGGASGLGLATARRLVAEGAQVALLDVNVSAGQSAAAELGDQAIHLTTDVRSDASVSDALSQAQQAMGGLNLAVNCAGIIGAARVLGREGPMDLDFFSNVIQINLVGSFNLARSAASLMQHNEPGEDGERGLIISTASVAAFEGQIGQAAYAASKGGIVSMTLPMARELGRFGIRVVAIAPGIFWTPMVDGMPPEVQESLGQSIPYPSRLGQPEEFADACCFIAANRYVNGTTLRLDGAVRMAPK